MDHRSIKRPRSDVAEAGEFCYFSYYCHVNLNLIVACWLLVVGLEGSEQVPTPPTSIKIDTTLTHVCYQQRKSLARRRRRSRRARIRIPPIRLKTRIRTLRPTLSKRKFTISRLRHTTQQFPKEYTANLTPNTLQNCHIRRTNHDASTPHLESNRNITL
jgi:hypothetical protein